MTPTSRSQFIWTMCVFRMEGEKGRVAILRFVLEFHVHGFLFICCLCITSFQLFLLLIYQISLSLSLCVSLSPSLTLCLSRPLSHRPKCFAVIRLNSKTCQTNSQLATNDSAHKKTLRIIRYFTLPSIPFEMRGR